MDHTDSFGALTARTPVLKPALIKTRVEKGGKPDVSRVLPLKATGKCTRNVKFH